MVGILVKYPLGVAFTAYHTVSFLSMAFLPISVIGNP
jgi:hypothetical protein